MIPIKYPLAGCAAAAALGALAAVGVAHAQPSGGGGYSQQNQAAQEQRLHDALHLNPHQEQAWQTYMAGIRPSPDMQAQMRAMSQMSPGGMSTPQRLDMNSQILNMQVTGFHRYADATRAFYATLNPTQQHTFDQITAPPTRSGQGSHY